MIGVDTNIVVRYLMADDEVQSPRAKTIMDGFTEEDPGFISLVTLLETVWVLKRRYKVAQEDTLRTLTALMASPVLRIQEESAVDEALEISRRENCDFPDALVAVLGTRAGCSRTLTFDRKAATIPGMEVI